MLSHFTLTVADNADVPGMAVELDGRQVPRAAWGTRMPIDSGSHGIVVSAPDRTPWSRRMNIGASGDYRHVEVPPESGKLPASGPRPSTTSRQNEVTRDDAGKEVAKQGQPAPAAAEEDLDLSEQR